MTMTKPLFQFAARLIVICICVAVLGCAGVTKLRDAQSAFNTAATADDQILIKGATPDNTRDNPRDAPMQASAGYMKTISILDGLTDEETEKLKADKLYGTALTIKAISYWRLKDYKSANDAAGDAQKEMSNLFPRDKALVQAMPALIRISQAYDAIPLMPLNPGSTQAFTIVDDQLTQAIQILDGSIANITSSEPVYVYLVEAELAAYRNKQDAVDKLRPMRMNLGLLPGERMKMASRLSDLQCAMLKTSSRDDVKRAIDLWMLALGTGNQPNPADCR